MTDYYSILGLNRSASPDDIKKAYRGMAMKHHPDRGGDEAKFKQINEAYEMLSDPNKKQMVDMGVDPKTQHQGHGGFNQGPFEFHFGAGNFEEVFNQFGFGFGGGRRQQRNKTFNIVVDITLEEVLTGKDINAEVADPSGTKKTININIPPGIEDGQQIRYQGLGDTSIRNVPPGDLIVNVRIRHHPLFRREGSDIILEKRINVWDAIIGTKVRITTLNKNNLEITIPPGTQPDTVLSCKGEGLPNMRSRARGNLLIRILVEIPKNLSADKLNIVKGLRDAI
jgi:curved DNA-binding protein